MKLSKIIGASTSILCLGTIISGMSAVATENNEKNPSSINKDVPTGKENLKEKYAAYIKEYKRF